MIERERACWPSRALAYMLHSAVALRLSWRGLTFHCCLYGAFQRCCCNAGCAALHAFDFCFERCFGETAKFAFFRCSLAFAAHPCAADTCWRSLVAASGGQGGIGGLRVPPTPSLDSLLTPLYRRRSAGGWRPRSAAFWRGALPLLQMLYPRFPTVQSGISESPLRHPRKSPDRPTHAVHATPDGKCSLFPQPAAPAPRSSLGQTRRMPKRAEEPSPPPACLCTLCAFHVQRQPTASSSSIHSSPPSSPPPSSPPSTGGSGSGTYCELYHSSVCTLQRPIDDMSASDVTPVK